MVLGTLLGLILLSAPAFCAPASLPGVPAPSSPAPQPAVASSSAPDAGRLALKFLERASAASDFEVRALAASAWGVVGSPAARPLLERALTDRNVYVRIEAATSLQKLGFSDEAFAALQAIVEGAPEAKKRTPAEEMRALARNKARILAIERLCDFGGEDAVKLFEKALKDPSDSVRDATAVALAKMGLDEFSQQFLEALKSPDEGVRAAAARSLGQIGGAQVPPGLEAAARDRGVSVRVEAMRALAGFAGPDAAQILAKGLSDADNRVRARALSSLAQLADPSSASVLHELEKNKPTAETKLKIMAGLARRGEKVEYDLVNDALHEKDGDLRALAFDVLKGVDDDGALPLLEDVMARDPDPRLRVQAAGLILKRLQRRRGA